MEVKSRSMNSSTSEASVVTDVAHPQQDRHETAGNKIADHLVQSIISRWKPDQERFETVGDNRIVDLVVQGGKARYQRPSSANEVGDDGRTSEGWLQDLESCVIRMKELHTPQGTGRRALHCQRLSIVMHWASDSPGRPATDDPVQRFTRILLLPTGPNHCEVQSCIHPEDWMVSHCISQVDEGSVSISMVAPTSSGFTPGDYRSWGIEEISSSSVFAPSSQME